MDEIFDLMAKFAGYGFNKSHSAAYALVAYQTAYLKTHYPVEFMAALLTSETSKPENVVKYISECREMGIASSRRTCRFRARTLRRMAGRQAIRFGLAAVKNVGGNAIESILRRAKKLGGRVHELLGVLREGRSAGDEQAGDRVADQGGRARFSGQARAAAAARWTRRWSGRRRRSAMRRRDRPGCLGCSMRLLRMDMAAMSCRARPDWEEGERLANEKEVLGFFVSGHPLDKYADKLRNLTGVISVAEALERKPPERRWGKDSDPADETSGRGHHAGTAGAEDASAKESCMRRRSLEDATGKIELIAFPRDYEKLSEQLKIEAPVLIRGTLSGDEDSRAEDCRSARFSLWKKCR